MRLVRVKEFGGPEVLRASEAPDPVARPGQVVINVTIAGVLFVDTQIRRGEGGQFFPVKPPYVPGFGVAGVVSSAGEGVNRDWVGRRVVAETNGGGYAERSVVTEEALIPVPGELDSREATALLHDGSTALALFEAAGIQPGEWVVVEPAGGGLGSLLVQLAYIAGARVIGAARGERKLALARELGAEAAVDYSEPDWVEQILQTTGGSGPDVVFDGIGGEIGTAVAGIIAHGGRFSVYGAASGTGATIENAVHRGVTVFGGEQLMGFAPGRKRRAERVLHDAAAGRIRPVIGQTYPLEQAANAHAAIEARSFTGKTLLLT